MRMPEEINRVLTDRISDLLLCPTDTAIENLHKEGFANFDSRVVKSGDIMKDAVSYYGKTSSEKSSIINNLSLVKNEFILATIHRQENTDNLDNLKSIFEGLEELNTYCKVVLPVHPRTRKALEKHNLSYNITTIEPVGYFDMLELLKHCKMVVTDSGGLQKEAFFNKKHCIIARDETEWIELVNSGFAKIIGSNTSKMIAAFQDFKNSSADFSVTLYGNKVGEKIYAEIINLIN
jgi:UDP-GlcNAc3NAcA epimerase